MKGELLTPLAKTAERYVLAEGPQWNPAHQTLSWVDIEGMTLSIAAINPDGSLTLKEQRRFDDRVSFAHPLDKERYLIGLGRTLAISAPGGVDEMSRPLVPLGRRLNDSMIDPAGRLLVGSMTLDGPHEGNTLMRVEHDGSVTTLDDDLRLSNGLGIAPDGSLLYSTDSLEGVVYRRSYAVDERHTGAREVFATFSDVEPDGLAVDATGAVWVALWGGGVVQRFAPDGSLTATVTVGPQHITSLEFAGADLCTVVVTTSMLLLDDAERAVSTSAGRVHTFAGATRGCGRYRWRALPLSRVSGVS